MIWLWVNILTMAEIAMKVQKRLLLQTGTPSEIVAGIAELDPNSEYSVIVTRKAATRQEIASDLIASAEAIGADAQKIGLTMAQFCDALDMPESERRNLFE